MKDVPGVQESSYFTDAYPDTMELYKKELESEISLSLEAIEATNNNEISNVKPAMSVVEIVTKETIAAFSPNDATSPEGLAEAVSNSVSTPPVNISLDWSPDYGIAMFMAAKTLKQPPVELAKQAAAALTTDLEQSCFEKIEAVGPYINLRIKENVLVDNVNKVLELGSGFGHQPKNGETVIVDFSSPNVAKPFGVNHLRSTVIGESIARLMDANGYTVVRDNHLGDWGTQFGNLLAAHEVYMPEIPFSDLTTDELNQMYVRYNHEKETRPELVNMGRDYFKRLNEKEPELLQNWYQAVRQSKAEFQTIYDRFGIQFDTQIGEAYFEEVADQLVDELNESIDSIVVEDNGAAYINDEHAVMLRTGDGYCVYAARDLATVLFRSMTYQPTTVIYVVGEEQSSSFRAMFDVAKKGRLNTNEKGESDLEHASFGLLLDASGKKLSTRKGTSGKLEDVIAQIDERALEEITKRNPDIPEDEARLNAEALSLAALIWNDLRADRKKNAKFDIDKMLELGSGGVVDVLYSYVRSNRVLEKYGRQHEDSELEIMPRTFTNNIEHTLALRLSELPEIVNNAANSRSPHILVTYLTELSKLHGNFYEQSPVLNEPNPEFREMRVVLHKAYKQVIENGLNLLNIHPPTLL